MELTREEELLITAMRETRTTVESMISRNILFNAESALSMNTRSGRYLFRSYRRYWEGKLLELYDLGRKEGSR